MEERVSREREREVEDQAWQGMHNIKKWFGKRKKMSECEVEK